MVKPMKLQGMVRMEQDRSLTFEGQLYDGAPFEIKVDQFDVQLAESFLPSRMRVRGHLFVQQEGKQASDAVYLTLPKPSLVHGRQVTVREHHLMPRNVSLEDFMPEKKSKKAVAQVDLAIKHAEELLKAKQKLTADSGIQKYDSLVESQHENQICNTDRK